MIGMGGVEWPTKDNNNDVSQLGEYAEVECPRRDRKDESLALVTFSSVATIQMVVSKVSTEFVAAQSRVLLPSLSMMVHFAKILIRFVINLA